MFKILFLNYSLAVCEFWLSFPLCVRFVLKAKNNAEVFRQHAQ